MSFIKKKADFNQPLLVKMKDYKLIVAIIVVIILACISLMVGAYDILNNKDGLEIFFITRVPRTLALMLTGSSMAMSGLVMQLMTQNKFVEPTTTGTIEWAGLGLILVYLVIPNPTILERMGGAIIFSFIGTMIFFVILRKIRLKSSLIVPLVGMMLGAIISSISTFVGLVFSMSQSLEIWFAGTFAPIQKGKYEYLFLIIIVSLIIFIMADKLMVAGFGKDVATNLGLSYDRVILIGTILISLTVGVVASVIGNLPFLGLIVPNVISIFRGDNLRTNLPWICVVGMGVIMACDIISRVLIMPFEIPVSLILGTIGSVVFMFLIYRKRSRR